RAFREPGDRRWWTIEVPELTSPGPGGSVIVATGGSVTARGIDRAARELVAAWLDEPVDGVAVRVIIEVPQDVAQLWSQGARAEAEGRVAIERGASLRRSAVRALRERGFSVEAAALALGVSRQRVQQLEKAPHRDVS
ncbi:MAG: hypothetical protein FWD74_02385, partial [Actinomycetia bacterium]|nr:hypothetical protein [Actinomycetes bacterium]